MAETTIDSGVKIDLEADAIAIGADEVPFDLLKDAPSAPAIDANGPEWDEGYRFDAGVELGVADGEPEPELDDDTLAALAEAYAQGHQEEVVEAIDGLGLDSEAREEAVAAVRQGAPAEEAQGSLDAARDAVGNFVETAERTLENADGAAPEEKAALAAVIQKARAALEGDDVAAIQESFDELQQAAYNFVDLTEAADVAQGAPEREVDWTYVNVSPYQVIGRNPNPGEDGYKTTSLGNPDVEPFANKRGSEFYRVNMLEGSVFERDGEKIDVSGHSFTVSAKCVHPNERFERPSVGLSFPEGKQIALTKRENQGGQWVEVSRIVAVPCEVRAAQHEGVMRYKAVKEYERSHPKQEGKRTVASVAAKAKARAAEKNAEIKAGAEAQSVGRSL